MVINMSIFPQSSIGQLFLILWLVACIAVLVFAFKQREIHDVGIAFCLFMLFLTFPIGFVAAGLGTVTIDELHRRFGIVLLDRFLLNSFVIHLVLWLFFVPIGYFQWFIIMPWLYDKI